MLVKDKKTIAVTNSFVRGSLERLRNDPKNKTRIKKLFVTKKVIITLKKSSFENIVIPPMNKAEII